MRTSRTIRRRLQRKNIYDCEDSDIYPPDPRCNTATPTATATPTPTPRPKASLDPRPANIRKDGTWHEFGHALGLRDLDKANYSGYLMARDELYSAGIPGPDWRYLEQVYRNEDGSRPH